MMHRQTEKLRQLFLLVVLSSSMCTTSFVLQSKTQQRSISTPDTGYLKMFSGENGETSSEEDFDVKTWNPLRLAVLKLGFTEPMYSSPLNYEKNSGVYECAFCGMELFNSNYKYDSGSGWPSFWRSANEDTVQLKREFDGRIECSCKRCGSHLGHVFPDGPKPDTMSPDLVETIPSSDPKTKNRLPRFCVNGASLRFIEQQ